MASLEVRTDISGLSQGSQYWKVAGDGNCLFASIAQLHFRDVRFQSIARIDAVSSVRKNWSMLKAKHGLEGSCKQYCETMSQDKVWGTLAEIEGLSIFYKKRFVVLHNGNVMFDSLVPYDSDIYYLRWASSHYDAYIGKPNLIDPKLSMNVSVLITPLSEKDWPSLRSIIKRPSSSSEKFPSCKPTTTPFGDDKLLMDVSVVLTPLSEKDWPTLPPVKQEAPVVSGNRKRKRANKTKSKPKRKSLDTDNSSDVSVPPPANESEPHTFSSDEEWLPSINPEADVIVSPPKKGDSEGKSGDKPSLDVEIDMNDPHSDDEDDSNSDSGSIFTLPDRQNNIPIVDSDDDDAVSDIGIPGVERPNPWVWPEHEVRNRPRLSVKPGKSRHYKCAVIYGDEDIETITPKTLGDCDWECEHCGALFWPSQLSINNKSTAHCCQNGTLILDPIAKFAPPKDHILKLYDGRDRRSKHFLDHILAYNRIFSTVYPSGRFEYVGKGKHSAHCLKVNGEVKFISNPFESVLERRDRAGNLIRFPGTVNQGHIFFMDLTVDTIRQRITNSTLEEHLDADIVEMFEKYLRENNQFIKWFRYTKEVYEEEKRKAELQQTPMREVVLVVNPKGLTKDTRRIGGHTYRQRILTQGHTAAPVNDFVAGVFTGEVPEYSYDLKYFPRERLPGEAEPNNPQPSMRTLDTQMYPLIFLHGEFSCLSWRRDPNKTLSARDNRREIDGYSPTIVEHARFRFMRRKDVSILHKSKRLFLHWLINSQLRAEYDRLEYYRLKQEELRMDTYKGMKDYITRLANNQNKEAGRIILIPPEFEGTTKHKRELFLDIMALIDNKGVPGYFSTFTCNGQWPEILQQAAKEGCDPKFRPDISNDVFYEFWLSAMSDIIHHQVLGEVVAHATVFEAQNRLLMHAHSLIILKPADTPRTAAEVDRVISARFPDPEKNPKLFELVKKFHVHGPCNVKRSTNFGWPCRSKNESVCRFDYPQQFRNSTDIDARKPAYKRPNDGSGFSKMINNKLVKVDNRWVTPHCPPLTLSYNNHFYIDYTPKCSFTRYLAKYFTKGAHTESVHITEKNRSQPDNTDFDWDEVKAYKEMRALGAPEAHFRLSGHSLSHLSHGVEKLPVHLEDEHRIVAQQGRIREAVEKAHTSKLEGWFQLNLRDPSNHKFYYHQVVEHHIWKRGEWQKTRSPRRTIGRICHVDLSIHSRETFFLRLLLVNRTGCTSYEDIRTIDGVLHPSNQAACVALGILEDDSYILLSIQEVENIATPFHLRRFFANILTHCPPDDPLALWYRFANSLSIDHFNRTRNRRESLIRTLRDLETLLRSNDITLETCNLPTPDNFQFVESDYPELIPEHPPIEEESRPAEDSQSPVSAEDHLNHLIFNILNSELTTEQSSFVNDVWESLEKRNEQKLFFLCAPGGTGKTTTLRYIAAKCLTQGISLRCVAATGIAAVELPRGQTAHRTFGIPLEKQPHEFSTSTLKLQSPEAKALKDVELIIWDECSMIASWQLDVVDHLFRRLKDKNEPFGNIVVILSGDLRQLPPVVKGGNRMDVVEACIVNSHLWVNFKTYSFNKNLRTEDGEEAWAKYILEVATGSHNAPNSWQFNIPHDLTLKTKEDLIQFVFPNFHDLHIRFSAILTPTNEGADEVNEGIVQDKFKQNVAAKVYLSATKLIPYNSEQDNSHITSEFLQTRSGGSIPHHRLELKEGVPVLLMRNLNVELGLCNGTRMVVEKLYQYSVLCKITSGLFKGEKHFIPRIIFTTDEFGLPGILRRQQFPLKLAFSITITKSQGQSVTGRCGIYLNRAPFNHEMLYVALSRSTKKSSVKIVVVESDGQGQLNISRGGYFANRNIFYTQNPIFPEILSHIPNLDSDEPDDL